jgi:hypothetical protein
MPRTLLRRLGVVAGTVSATLGLSVIPSTQMGFVAFAAEEALPARAIPSPFNRFIPPHTMGDREFSGNGPEVDFDAKLIVADAVLPNDRRRVILEFHMKAQETTPDRTTVEGSSTFSLGVVQLGSCVTVTDVRLANGTSVLNKPFSFTYTDTNHSDDIFLFSGTPVSKLDFVGDTGGNDVGETGVRIATPSLTMILSPC